LWATAASPNGLWIFVFGRATSDSKITAIIVNVTQSRMPRTAMHSQLVVFVLLFFAYSSLQSIAPQGSNDGNISIFVESTGQLFARFPGNAFSSQHEIDTMIVRYIFFA
jgi:hypothetical protein